MDPGDMKEVQRFSRSKKVVMPVDFRWHHGSAARGASDAILDVGPKSVRLFAAKIAAARTILWSGPLGFIEKPAFARSSVAVAKAIARNRRAFSVAGGGETVYVSEEI